MLDLARSRCDVLVASIYVNPLQFGPEEDLDTYPRDLLGDTRKCTDHGVDVLFMPETLYVPDHSTRVSVVGLTDRLCGSDRPGHFEGVTTVVCRLFGLVQPHLAVFGEKDFQQLAVIRRMVKDLALTVEVVGGPLIRDDDGVALSSRNAHLSTDGRRQARSLHQALFAMREAVLDGERSADTVKALGRGALEVDELDYLDIVEPTNLASVDRLNGPAHALVAARVGSTRLIDNLSLITGAEAT